MIKPSYPLRKQNRLPEYDYHQQGAYFITICTKNHTELFGRLVGANSIRPPNPHEEQTKSGRITSGRPQVAPTVASTDALTEDMPPHIELSTNGQMVQNEIETLANSYPAVSVDTYVIMPNHVHMIIVIGSLVLVQRELESLPVSG